MKLLIAFNKKQKIGTVYSSKYDNTAFDIIPISNDLVDINYSKRDVNNGQANKKKSLYNSNDNSHIIGKRDVVLSKYCDLDYVMKLSKIIFCILQ